MFKIKEDIKNEILEVYKNENISVRDVAKQFSIAGETVSHILRSNGIKPYRRAVIRPRQLTDGDKNELINFYLSGKGLLTTAAKFNVGYEKCRGILESNNIKIRNSQEASKIHKCVLEKYKINENFFKNVNEWTEKQAWVLGWFGSDGNNYTPKSSFFIKLQERDKPILEIIRNLLEYEGPLIYGERKTENPTHSNVWILQIRNKKMSEDLFNLGIVDNKSLIYEFPKFLPEHLIRHYIRGYFEGDGHMSKIGSDKSLMFNQIGTKKFLEYHNLILNKQIGIRIKNISPKNSNLGNYITSFYNIGDKLELYKLYHYLYDDAQYFLARKKERFDNFVDYLISKPKYSFLNPHKV